jgi:hypothetical protein
MGGRVKGENALLVFEKHLQAGVVDPLFSSLLGNRIQQATVVNYLTKFEITCLSRKLLGNFSLNHIFYKVERPTSTASDYRPFNLNLSFFVPSTVLVNPENDRESQLICCRF